MILTADYLEYILFEGPLLSAIFGPAIYLYKLGQTSIVWNPKLIDKHKTSAEPDLR